MTRYDYIIIGAGAAGLMLADAMGKDAFFKNKTILLLDKDAKQNNDRTWCFWEKGNGRFDDVLYRKWTHIFFGGKKFSKRLAIAPYSYKMVRGLDFYNSFFKNIEGYSNIVFQQETVESVVDRETQVVVTTNGSQYLGGQVFNSIFDYKMATHQKKHPVLQQHFIGWVIKTEKPVFAADQATYMDFSVPQKGNTRFMYVLPFSENEALVEYTLFSKAVLPENEYEEAIEDYLESDLGLDTYEIVEKEKGSIPMTCYDFNEHHSVNVRYIGTAGGWAKPSTGYTFMSTARKTPKLLEFIKSGKPLDQLSFKNRFWYYDMLLLDILFYDNGQGQPIFEALFKNRSPQLIFKFLDERSNLWEDLKIVLGSPKLPFSKALLKRLF